MTADWFNQLPLPDIQEIVPVSGGDVNETFQVHTKNETYFLLLQPDTSKDFFETEVASLELFRENEITAPQVIEYNQIDGDAYLLLEYLIEGYGKQEDLAKLIAKMHRVTSENNLFGFHLPHYGSDITFDNSYQNTWSQLFINQRMIPLSESLVERNLWKEEDIESFQVVRQKMFRALEHHESIPSLLHGDLWGGNHMFLKDGRPVLFDPSSFFGDREFDIGVSTVFASFGDDFYQAYNEAYPLAEGYQERLEFYRLYLLMVHLLKFGQLYANRVKESMEQIKISFN